MLLEVSQQNKLKEEKVQINNVQMNTKDKVKQSKLVKVEKAIIRVGIVFFALNNIYWFFRQVIAYLMLFL